MKRVVYIDYDSTLVDFLDSWLLEIKESRGVTIQHSDITYFNHPELEKHVDLFTGQNLYKKRIRPFAGARELIEDLQKEYTVVILTHTPKEMRAWKTEHILKHFGDLGVHVILTTKSKYLFSNGGVLIDDGWHNIKGHLDNTEHLGLLFNHNNRYHHNRVEDEHERLHMVSSYDDIRNLLLGGNYD
jgi:5'(3')-deoxyribonucleotidase